jgi:hypothetical protein
MKIEKFRNFLENISKERFLQENDGKVSFEKKKFGGLPSVNFQNH